jgi:short-subunit dehydrogenase
MFNTIKKFIASLLSPAPNIVHAREDLRGLVVLVTGASRGIGEAISRVLLEEGASLVVVARSKRELEAKFPDTSGASVLRIAADVTSESDVAHAVQEAIAKYGKIDVLVNNAGMFLEKPVDQITSEELNSLIQTNIAGVVRMTGAVVSHMKKNGGGLIINIGSKISHNTNVLPNKTLYAMTKYAVEGFSSALRNELRPFGIRVTCLMPGTVNTFFSLKGGNYLHPRHVAQVISMIIRLSDIAFEDFVIKSKNQDI